MFQVFELVNQFSKFVGYCVAPMNANGTFAMAVANVYCTREAAERYAGMMNADRANSSPLSDVFATVRKSA
jgi:hypothetical protein